MNEEHDAAHQTIFEEHIREECFLHVRTGRKLRFETEYF